VLVLGAVLVFSGLLLAGLAKVAYDKVRASRAWARAVSELESVRPSDLSGTPSLAAVRGVVHADEIVSDALTGEPSVFFEVEVTGPENESRFPMIVTDARRFFVMDSGVSAPARGSVEVDPKTAATIDVRRDVWESEDDRERVAAFLKSHGLANRADIRIEHRTLAPGQDVVVIGRPRIDEARALPGRAKTAGYRGEAGNLHVFEGTDVAPLTITTSTLEAFVERELASAKTSLAGVVLLALVGGATALAGALALAL
jgi:hypothetical protein